MTTAYIEWSKAAAGAASDIVALYSLFFLLILGWGWLLSREELRKVVAAAKAVLIAVESVTF